ncbi:unnamed protein product [Lymnaea stagnalis]|uniref:Uncharacterized protein n=1 Tax=Lymnaea stagnalis TaxID=6523 RepID=A0AAV2H1W7_LYMST
MPFYAVFLWKNVVAIVLLSYSTNFVCATVSSHEWDTEVVQNESYLSTISYTHLFLIVIGSVMSFLFLVVFLIPTCMDCMNSEVSSDTNPACGGTTPKWGGATNYTTNEVRVPSSLPYSVNPHLQEGSGFIGYQAAGYPAPAATNDGSRLGPEAGQFQRHFSPFDQEPPPPPYEAAVAGNR